MLKRSLKLCSMMLVFAMLFHMLPPAAFAATESTSSQASTAGIVEEITDKRTEYTKEFKLSNGLRIAAVYSDAVHFEKDGQWAEIDNTLIPKLNGSYVNTDGIWDVTFPGNIGTGNVTIEKDGYTLSFAMAGELRQSGNLEIMGVEPETEAQTALATEPAPTEALPEQADPVETIPEETDPVETIPPETIAETMPETVPVTETVEAVPSQETVSLSIGGTSETLAVNAAMSSAAKLQKVDLTQMQESYEYPEMIVEKNASQLLYSNVYSGTDVQYDLQSNQVKESIIMDAYSSTLRGYRYTLNVSDMVPVLQEEGSIIFYDKNKENVVLFMPAPYLVDANNVFNYDIHVSLTGGNGVYSLIYILPQAWLAASDRGWPVVLDPVVQASLERGNIRDVSFSTKSVVSYTAGTLIAGYSTDRGSYCRFLVKYRNLPTLTSSDVIISSSMQIYKPYNSSVMVPVEAHKVLGTWESESLTMSNIPGFDTQIEDYTLVEDSGYYTWDITDIVQGWYEGENTGVMFKADDATEADSSKSSLKEFYSSDWGTLVYKPSLTIVYRNNNGLESYWDYTSSSAGRAGTGYVNNFTGNMVWVRSDMGFGGNRMPVSINHVYNLNDAANNDFGMGYGWRTNFNQQVYQWSENSKYYVWEDSDGTKHYFEYSSSNTYIDEDGLELTLKTNGSGTKKYSITDKNGNVSYFDTYGRLTSIQNNQKTVSSITITYTTTSGKLIDYITDGVGRKYDFTYSSSLLSNIKYTGSGSTALATTTFTYSSSNLTSVKDTDSKSSTYTYSGHILLTASDIDGYKLQYAYYTPAGTYQPYRVKKVAEFDGTVAGGELSFAYTHNQTTITDHNGNSEILQFNNMGNTVSIQDGLGRAQFSKYYRNNEEDTAGKANQLKLSSKLQNTVGNRFSNGNFEAGSAFSKASGSGSFTTSTAAAYLGKKSLAITNDMVLKSSTLSVAKGRTETFSAYVKTGTATAWIEYYDGTNTYKSETLPANSGWTRLQVTYANTGTSAASVMARIVTEGTGTTYVDCVQWEYAASASRYNIVENGDFRQSTHAWSSLAGRTTKSPSAAPELSSNAYQMTGSPTAQSRINQTVQVNGSKGDTFVFAGWAKGDSASLTEEAHDAGTRQFGIIATFNYTDGTTKEFVAQFNPDVDADANWQYVSEVMVAEKAYSSIKIELAYDYNVNTVYFDGIQLYKEAFGSSYTYDDDGNVTSVVDLQNQTTTYEYTNNNLTAEVLPTGARLEYVYDSYHNVTKATTEEGLVYNFTYDTYGNNTKVSISGSPTLSSSATYSSDGNRLASTTDAAGKKTTYNYNANTNVLEWVQYPEDTTATRTEYTYDNMYRMATASATTDTGLDLTASYVYNTDDTLKSITTGSTTYNFAYGNFALRSSVKAGTRTLATYTYTGDKNNYLQKLAYGNGDSVQYTYDKQGRVTKETYEDGSTVSYVYDNSGALATVTDSQSGITTTYYYDFIDRMMKYVENGTNYSHSVGYEYDTINNLTKRVETINGSKYATAYSYDDDNRITSVTEGSISDNYTYDSYGRLDEQIVKSGSAEVITNTYGYDGTTTTTTGRINSKEIITNNFFTTYTLVYDDNGNITMAIDGTIQSDYVYDTANQLVREDNYDRYFTHTWTYDDAGNILNRKEYAYTSAATLGTPTKTVTYTYANTDWGDLLTGYDGKSISYDTIGNPLTVKDASNNVLRSYTWQHGRQLASLTEDGTTWNYTYNADGLRTKRTNGTTTYQYVYNGDKLSQLTVAGHTMKFVYGSMGPVAVVYDGTTYYYVTNLQGDVTYIVDGAGEIVVEYGYDAWGNTYTTYDDTTGLGTYNPLRYRSYVYDQESGLYYLQSRYYDPEVGRFLNADAYASTGQGLLGNNMFVYCLNNPVNYVDYSGELSYPGEIHNEVEKRIAEKYGYKREQQLVRDGMRWGRADLISPDGQVWDVKRDKPWHLAAGKSQVKRYTQGTWLNNPDTPLRVGKDTIESDSFTYKSGLITYEVTYRDAGDGVIAYDYRITDFDTETASQVVTTFMAAVVGALLTLLGGAALGLA